jgi:hypothetical protein
VVQPLSDKHGFAADEQLKTQRTSSSDGTHHTGRPEDGEDEPIVLVDEDDRITARAEIARFLGPAAFPGDVSQLLAVAEQNNATDEVFDLLAPHRPAACSRTCRRSSRPSAATRRTSSRRTRAAQSTSSRDLNRSSTWSSASGTRCSVRTECAFLS